MLVFALMKMPIAAIAAFFLFFFFWATLQSVGRDPELSSPRARRYFRFVTLIGLFVVAISIFGFGISILNGNYRDAFHSIGPAVLIFGVAWKYREQWRLWLRK